MAAERMQREEAATYAARVDKINRQLQAKSEESEELEKQVADLTVSSGVRFTPGPGVDLLFFQAKLDEANVVLESASRLNEQLEAKEQSIDQLRHLGELEAFQPVVQRLASTAYVVRLAPKGVFLLNIFAPSNL